jgi:peptidoglycan/xylan/chitin deacetylase (PgdA/CDA1 family)
VAFRVALTFDAEHPDRPHPADPSLVLEELAGLDVTATFFLQGRWVESEPRLARRIRDAGHLIGSHSHYHARMPLFDDAGFEADVRAAESVIRRTLHVDARPWFRLPFGAGGTRADLVDRLAALGYRHVGWDVEPKEWRTRATIEDVATTIHRGARERGDGAIVLLHTWPRTVAGALRRAIPQLLSAGAMFVRIDQLDLPAGLEPIAEPRPPLVAGR